MSHDTPYCDGCCPLSSTEMQKLKLHADGEFLTGLDANVTAWRHTRFGFFYRWLAWSLVRSIADWIYSRWAKVRYRRLYSDKGSDLS